MDGVRGAKLVLEPAGAAERLHPDCWKLDSARERYIADAGQDQVGVAERSHGRNLEPVSISYQNETYLPKRHVLPSSVAGFFRIKSSSWFLMNEDRSQVWTINLDSDTFLPASVEGKCKLEIGEVTDELRLSLRSGCQTLPDGTDAPRSNKNLIMCGDKEYDVSILTSKPNPLGQTQQQLLKNSILQQIVALVVVPTQEVLQENTHYQKQQMPPVALSDILRLVQSMFPGLQNVTLKHGVGCQRKGSSIWTLAPESWGRAVSICFPEVWSYSVAFQPTVVHKVRNIYRRVIEGNREGPLGKLHCYCGVQIRKVHTEAEKKQARTALSGVLPKAMKGTLTIDEQIEKLTSFLVTPLEHNLKRSIKTSELSVHLPLKKPKEATNDREAEVRLLPHSEGLLAHSLHSAFTTPSLSPASLLTLAPPGIAGLLSMSDSPLAAAHAVKTATESMSAGGGYSMVSSAGAPAMDSLPQLGSETMKTVQKQIDTLMENKLSYAFSTYASDLVTVLRSGGFNLENGFSLDGDDAETESTVLLAGLGHVLYPISYTEFSKILDLEHEFDVCYVVLNEVLFTILPVVLRGTTLALYHEAARSHPADGRLSILAAALRYEVEGVPDPDTARFWVKLRATTIDEDTDPAPQLTIIRKLGDRHARLNPDYSENKRVTDLWHVLAASAKSTPFVTPLYLGIIRELRGAARFTFSSLCLRVRTVWREE
ncbi:hypothetical protein CYMTET_56865 [Cymbomonas tetramitiformis]|uniref:Uncharacterized protein n=1 Tax=Cymbomonas tetramitiformis TaxID=36881 RepID=A0AAE0BAF3_9CHLO|nr:hypothetical protein CYMTET_56865 [Cymbomonas tetramitiformis]